MNFQPGAVQLVLQLRSYLDSPRFVGTPPLYRKASNGQQVRQNFAKASYEILSSEGGRLLSLVDMQ